MRIVTSERGYSAFVQCIGHGGASALAPANTIRSFELAVELGADVIEFDVRLARRGRLLLAHTPLGTRRSSCLTLDEALDALAGPRFEDIGLVVDLKTAGTEAPVVDGLRRRDLLERSLIASQCPPILANVRAYDPDARTAISVAGRLSRRLQGWREWRIELLAAIRDCGYAAVMAHRRLVDADLVERVSGAGAQLHAWTLDGMHGAADLARLGVDGIVTNDPRYVRPALT